MASYFCTARSNFVRFEDGALDHLQALFDVVPLADGQNPERGFALLATSGEPMHDLEIESDRQRAALDALGVPGIEDNRISFFDAVSFALAKGQVFVWTEVGSSGFNALNGVATAIDSSGRVLKRLDLMDIYEDGWSRAEA